MKAIAVLVLISAATAGCELAAGIFKGGLIVGLLIAVVVIGLLIKLFGGRGKAP